VQRHLKSNLDIQGVRRPKPWQGLPRFTCACHVSRGDARFRF
jgi:hypothetical protein